MAAQATGPTATEALVEKLFVAGVGAMELCCAYLDVRLGLYRALAVGGPQSAAELAERAGYRATIILPIEHPFWRFYRLEP
jgi:hypothetical protein